MAKPDYVFTQTRYADLAPGGNNALVVEGEDDVRGIAADEDEDDDFDEDEDDLDETDDEEEEGQ